MDHFNEEVFGERYEMSAIGFYRSTSDTPLTTLSQPDSGGGSINTAFTMDADERCRRDFTDPKSSIHDKLLTLNIGGFQHQTRASILARLPKSLLADPGRREKFYDASSDSYFFDRNRLAFDSILEYYRTGKLIKPDSVPIYVFIREMLYFDLGDEMIHDYLQAEALYDEPAILPTNKVQKIVYDFFNRSESSLPARLLAVLDIVLVITAITAMCVVTLPDFQDVVPVSGSGNQTVLHRKYRYKAKSFSNPFFAIDVICNTWFILDLVVRFLVSSVKRYFFLDFMTLVDMISIVPFLVDNIPKNEYSGPSINFLLAFRILRLFRIFKVLKMDDYSDGLKVLRQTVSSAYKELGIMALFLSVGAVFFSITMYYAEKATPGTDYTSIPATFWWAIITWTTIGYGDTYPKTPSGKVVGCICAISGVLALAMIVPPVVRRFDHYFYRAENMRELEAVFREHYAEKERDKRSKEAFDGRTGSPSFLSMV